MSSAAISKYMLASFVTWRIADDQIIILNCSSGDYYSITIEAKMLLEMLDVERNYQELVSDSQLSKEDLDEALIQLESQQLLV
jgi:hypothetical protein